MTSPRRHLRSRIIWTTALVSLLAMGATTGTVVLALDAVTRRDVASSLRDRFLLDQTNVRDDPRGPRVALRTPIDAVEDGTWLYDAAGTQVLGPATGRRVASVLDTLSTVTGSRSLTEHERVYLAGPVSIGGPHPGPGVLVVSQSMLPYEETRTEILLGLLALGLLVTAGSTAVAAWTMARTLAPIDAMAGLAEDWSQSDLDERFDDRASERQIVRLGHTLNLLLDRVAGALRSEQRLTSELAHELRTPLAGIRGEVELALLSETDPVARARLDRVVGLVDQMTTTIATLMALARGERRQEHSTTVDAVLTATLGGRPADERRVRRPDAPAELRVGATTDLASRALSPLVDNALHYARDQVTVSVASDERTVGITVSDDGPGIDLADQDTDALFAAGAKAVDSPGAGLGLALARRVASTLGGDVSMSSPRHPTSFTLTLPRA